MSMAVWPSGYCASCGYPPCQCPGDTAHIEELPACDTCAGPVDPHTGHMCWSCNAHTCDDCVDAYEWPCSHYREDVSSD